MKKQLTTKDYLINERNKNEVAENLIYCYEKFLIKMLERPMSKDDIENFLTIIHAKEQHLYKLHKIF
jgi:hypothetical protein